MQELDYQNLQDDITQKIVEVSPSLTPRDILRASVREAFEKVKEEGKLDSLSPDEVCLLRDYRLWKLSFNSVSGVFHWKKTEI